MVQTHEIYMRRAIELANKGRFKVSPNPRVGAVIVHNDSVIGEGYHEYLGGPHAEVNAINSVKEKSLLSQSTIYVTLEPCSHFGKTPPCSDLIIENKIPRVVIGSKDPYPEVNGKGIERLIKNGIEVIEGILEEEANELNKRFFTFHKKKRPYVILKWAETEDGLLSRDKNDPLFNTDNWISGAESKQLVHAWRAEEDAILIGYKTAVLDNPELTTREVKGENPIRIVIDKNLELNGDLNVFKPNSKVIVFNQIENKETKGLKRVKLDFSNSKFFDNLLSKLYEENIQSIIIEGGASTLNSFIKSNLWDEARVFIGIKEFKSGLKSPFIAKKSNIKTTIGEDTLNYYYNH